jgi:Domain of unknown function (DUF4124)
MQVQSTGLGALGYARCMGRRYTARQFFTWCFETMVRPFVALLALLAASLISLPATAQWKWRDKGGHVQYSDLPPPPGTPESDVLARPSASMRRGMTSATVAAEAAPASSAAATGAASAPRSSDPELEAKRKKAEAEATAKNKAEQERVAALKLDNCSRARAQMATLKSGIRLATTNAKTGEREFMDDKQRADEQRRVQDVISNDCK